MSQSVTRLGIAINLDELEKLMLQYRAECAANHDSNQLLRELILSGFLIWLSNRQRQRESVATTATEGDSNE